VHGIESRLSSSSSAPATNNSNKATNNNNDVSNSLVATFAHHLRDAWRKELLKELLESDEK
jgi:hypothetical protein